MNTSDRPAADEDPNTAHRIAAAVREAAATAPQQLSPAGEKLRDQMAALIVEYEREANEGNTDPYSVVRQIAAPYLFAVGSGQQSAYLDGLAAELDLADVQALRIGGEIAAAITPRMVYAAADDGKKPPRIAAELGLTASRVYGLLRERPAQTPADEE